MHRDVVAYIPVLHRGYLDFLDENTQQRGSIWVIDSVVAHRLRSLQKDMRALEATEAVDSLRALGYQAQIATPAVLGRLNQSRTPVVMPDEDISHVLAEVYIPECDAEYSPTFLRWNEGNVTLEAEPIPEAVTNIPEFLLAYTEAALSSDFWRRVGAAAFRDGELLVSAYNQHLPSEYEPYFSGDPRAVFKKGLHIEISTALHAEAGLIAKAAALGIPLAGSDLYVTTFPCPPCAKLIAGAGFASCTYATGYSMLDGESVMKAAGIKLVQLAM